MLRLLGLGYRAQTTRHNLHGGGFSSALHRLQGLGYWILDSGLDSGYYRLEPQRTYCRVHTTGLRLHGIISTGGGDGGISSALHRLQSLGYWIRAWTRATIDSSHNAQTAGFTLRGSGCTLYTPGIEVYIPASSELLKCELQG